MGRWYVLFALVFAALVAGGFPHLEAQVNRAAFLRVIDARPAPVAPLALDQAVSLLFNRRVDCREAEAAFRWAPAIDGNLGCDEFSLTFSPRGKFERETAYTFTLAPPLRAKDGAVLAEPYQASYLTVGYLGVAEVLPSGAVGSAPADSAITVVFDRPVAPLTAPMDAGDLPQPLRLRPSVAGAGEWINSAIYQFRPAAALKSDSRYTVIIDEGLTAVDGAILPRAYSWTFETAAPSIVSIDPPPGKPDLALAPMLQLRFSQALDRAAIERAFYLRPLADEGGAAISAAISGAFQWSEDGLGFGFAPQERLRLDAAYEAGFSSELSPELRFSNLPGGSWRYHTVPAPAISATEPVDGAGASDRGGFSLFFASMMNIETLPERIMIEPAPELPPRYYFSEWSKRYTVSFDAQPSTAYTVRIAPGMEDIYGNAISEALTFSYRTAPRPPELGLTVPGPVGFYNAYRARTELYLHHRGVEHVDLELSRVPLADFVGRLTGEEHYDPAASFAPAEDQVLRRWRIESDRPENVTGYELLSLSGEEGGEAGLEAGIYFLEAQSPGLERIAWQNRHFLNVASAVVTVKQATDRLTIWAVDVESGEAISGADIDVYGAKGARVGGGATDESGIAIVDIPYTRDLYSPFVAALSTDEHFGIGYTGWSNGAEPWNFGYRFSWSPRAYQTYLYTDRPVYRSGQPVYFRGIIRSKDDVVYMPAPYEAAPVTIRDAEGEIVFERKLPLNDFGAFSGEFGIAEEAPLGAYTLEVSLPREDEFIQEGGAITFLVAEYRLPEYQVKLSTDSPEIAQGASAAFDLEGRYFFGGEVSDAEAEYTVYAAPYEFNYTGEGRYDFSDRDVYEIGGGKEFSRVVAEGSLSTDSDGRASFALIGDLSGEAGSQEWRVEAAIRDEAGQAIYDSANLVVHQAMLYIGARAANTVGVAGEESVINLIAVDWDSQPLADQPLDIRVYERRWISLQEQDPATGALAWTWDLEEIPVAAGRVITAGDGKASFLYRPAKGGVYKIMASARDAAGFQARAATYAWASGPEYVSWRQENNYKIQLVPESTNYSVGDRGKILIASPFQGRAEALISIERGDVLSAERVSLTSNSQIYEFEILPQHAPNIFVNVFLVKPGDDNHEAASWRAGMTQLLIDIEQKALSIDISADADAAAPQDRVAYRLRVRDYRGEPVVAEVGIGVTDVAALSVGARNSEPMLESFYGPQDLSVRTSSSLIVNAEAVTAALSERKGGGGGGVFESGIVDLRGEFVDTAYWNPSVITDANGEAAVELRLPDNLSTWRLDARALTRGRDGRLLVGEGTHDLVSARPLLIRPVTPRFFVVGDRVQLAAVVNNNTGRDIRAIVSIDNVAGLELSAPGEQSQTVMIAAGGRQRVTWPAQVADVASVAPSFVVRSADGEFADASVSLVSGGDEGRLPVFRYAARETAGVAGQLAGAGARSEAVRLPRDLEIAAGRLDIRLDKSLAGVTNQSLTYLEGESGRFGDCNSAVVSRFLPNIVSYRALSELGLAEPALAGKLDKLVSEGLQILYGRQLANGGWSWCSYPEAEAMTSAYALFGLAAAERQGYSVDANVVRRAQRYLREQLIAPALEVERRQLNRQAFILYALAESGAADIARSTTLYESRDRLNLDATAFLAMTLHRINAADHARLDTLTQLMLNRAVLGASGAFFEETYQDRWNWSTDTRSTALALSALLKLRPESELLPNIVRRLVSARDGNGYWASAQESAWSIIALTDWMLFSGELNPDYVYSVSVNDVEVLRDFAMSDTALTADTLSMDLAGLIESESNIVEFKRDEGAGALYYTAHLNLDVPVDRIEATSHGIEVSRSYSALEDESEAPVTGAAIGDAVKARLRITVPSSMHYVVIEDFFPAGAEAVNPDLETSPRLGALARGQRLNLRGQGWGWWHFDHVEFRDERVVIYASELPAGVYEFIYTLRPTIAGEFNVIPPAAQAVYFPEVYGRGGGSRFRVSEA